MTKLEETLRILEADMTESAARPYLELAARYLQESADHKSLKPVPLDADQLYRLLAAAPPATGHDTA